MTELSISIIIPAYNVERYLEAALDSIRQQSHAPDEVIIIDDGSTDRTLEIAKSYSFPFPCHVKSVQNGGQGKARNLGLELASSEYIYFFDSDDILMSSFIRCMKEQILLNEKPDIVFFSGESFNDGDYRGGRWVQYSRGFGGFFRCRSDFLDLAASHDALFCSPCLYVSKRSFWGGQSGLSFSDGYLEDQAIFFPLLFFCNSFLVVDEVFFLRRNRQGSTMTMTPNHNHVSGAMNCISAALAVYLDQELTAGERKHVRNKICAYCITYIRTARRASMAIDIRRLLGMVIKVKSINLVVVVFLYLTHLNQFAFARKVAKFFRKLPVLFCLGDK